LKKQLGIKGARYRELAGARQAKQQIEKDKEKMRKW